MHNTPKNQSYRTALVQRSKKKTSVIGSAIMLMLMQPFSSWAAGEFNAEQHLTGDWGGVRAELAEKGVNVRLGHFSQTAYNIQGGESSEVAYADHEFDKTEQERLPELIKVHTGLTTQECLELMDIAKQEVDASTSIHQFTRHLNEKFSLEEKTELLTTLWSVAYADGNIDKYEDHMIRRISDLLHLRHSEFIKAKHDAKEQF